MARDLDQVARLQVALLGGVEVRLPAGHIVPLPGQTAPALLGYLAARAGRWHTREDLCALLWPHVAASQARHRLRQTLVVLRRAFAPAGVRWLLNTREGIAVDRDTVDVDVSAFEAAVSKRSHDTLASATSLYRGDLLAGLREQAPPFEDWLLSERERLRELALDALARLLREQTRADDPTPAMQTALRILALDPLQEPVHRAVMRLFARQGRRAAALRQYQVCVELLRRELGAEPEPETQELYQRLLRQAPAPSTEDTADPSARQAETAAPQPALVGRGAEITLLQAIADDVRRGHGRAVLIAGEAGVGKTRLLSEVAREWVEHGGRVLSARCHAIQRAVAFSAWTAALENAVRPDDLDRLLGRSSLLRRLLGLLLPDQEGLRVDPEAATLGNRDALSDAVVTTLRGLADERPLLIALDDVHWADASSLELVSTAVRALSRSATLVVMTARDEDIVDVPSLEAVIGALSHEQHLRRVDLPALSRADVQRLVRDVIGPVGADVEHAAERAWRISDGNPLLVIETARDATTSSRGGRGGTPQAVRTLLAARLDRLSAPARRVAEIAAVIGREFEFPLIARASGLPRQQAAACVDELVRRRVIRSIGRYLDFTHDLIRDAVASGLGERAPTLHRAVARALLADTAADHPATARRLAYHYAQAGMTTDAIGWLSRYADHSLSLCAPGEAMLAIDQALAHVEALRPVRRAGARLDLLLQQATALAFKADYGAILRRLLPEEASVEAVGDPSLAARYYIRVSLAQIITGVRDGLARRLERGLQAAALAKNSAAHGRLLYARAANAYTDGEIQASIALAREAVAVLDSASDHRWLAVACWLLGVGLLTTGHIDEARAAEERSTEAAYVAGDPGVMSYGAATMAWVLFEQGELDGAEARCRQALAGASEPINAASAVGFLGLIHLERGDQEKGIALLEQAVTQSPVAGRRELFAVPLAEALLDAGQLSRARELVADLRTATAASASALSRGRLGRVEAGLAVHDQSRSRADELIERAIEDLASIPAPFDIARTCAAAARTATRNGDVTKAKDYLERARQAYAAAGATSRAAHMERLQETLGAPR